MAESQLSELRNMRMLLEEARMLPRDLAYHRRARLEVQGRVRWEGDLPPGYRLEEDPDLLLLLRPDGSVVAAFSAQGADPLEVVAAAWEDHGQAKEADRG